MELANHAVHVERFSRSGGPEAEEVGVVGQLVLAFLAGYVNGHGHSLSVCVVDFQWSLLRMLDSFLIHHADGCIGDGQEAVIVLVHPVAVAGERVDKQFQLIVGTLGDMDAEFAEGVLQMVGRFGHINRLVAYNNQVVMRIDELLRLAGDDFLHCLDVLHGNLVARVGHRGVAVFLLLQHRKFSLLIGKVDYLVEDYCVGAGNRVDVVHEVHRHRGVVDLNVGEGAQLAREVDGVNIHKREDFCMAAADANLFLVNLEVVETRIFGRKVQCEIAVHIVAECLAVKIRCADTCVLQLVTHLLDLHDEILPFACVVGEEFALLVLLSDDKVGACIGVLTVAEVVEVAL